MDGHGGDGASQYCAPELARNHARFLEEHMPNLPPDEQIAETFVRVDSQFRDHVRSNADQDSGSTVVGAVISKQNNGNYSLKILNCGDSRGLVVLPPSQAGRTKSEEDEKKEEEAKKNGRSGSGPVVVSRPHPGEESGLEPPAFLASIDHKPDHPVEQARIEAAGGFVSTDDPPRLDKNLAVSRGVGDFLYKSSPELPPDKQKVSCLPDVYEVSQLEPGSVVVLACDGLWDVMSNKQVADLVSGQLQKKPDSDLGTMCADLVHKALKDNSRDNITVMIIQLTDGSSWSTGSARFNDSDEMMMFDKLSFAKMEKDHRDWKEQSDRFLRRCDFPSKPDPCVSSGRWFKTMWKCPKTGNHYCNKHFQKKHWNEHFQRKNVVNSEEKGPEEANSEEKEEKKDAEP